MLRAVLEPLVLFLSPFVVFGIYLVLRARYPLAIEHWSRGRVSTLTLVGLFLAIIALVIFGLNAPRGHGLAVPAHIEKGVLVPGSIE
jgi:hypothetical protein